MNETVLINWLRRLADEMGGRAIVEGKNIRLQPVSPKWASMTGSADPVCIASQPENAEGWRMRLQYVEKSSAREILAGPVGYSCSLNGSNDLTTVIRLAFGLSLSIGPGCNCRYTAYYLANTEVVSYICGSDRLFDKSIEICALDLREKNLRAGAKNLLNLVREIESEYRQSMPVQEQIRKLNESLSGELRVLERFYTPDRSEYLHAIGNLDQKLKGEDRLDAEYANKAQDIIEKYQVNIIFRPLSLGIIYCNLKIKEDAKALRVSLPFVDEPLTVQP